ncbi:hypothetical protein [uncultured Algibacter sp.]|uniref:hypothetical protein n=1 Tax=uncultured Algibacter sp. TaxID=298659 RepID=UPI002625887D|nr:hypothetical protein [uncultured Algibacter sp.]
MMFFKLKAGALQFAMFIVVVIALLLSAFIILIHTYNTFKVQTSHTIETISNADKGILYALKNDLQLNDTILVELQDEDYKTLKVHRDFWGVFEKVVSVSSIKNKSFKKMGLIGASQPEKYRIALYLENHNKPLVVVGNTRIVGVTYIPKRGVRTGNISGHAYYGQHLIYGKQRLSNNLPILNSSVLKSVENIGQKFISVDATQFIDLQVVKSFKNSFYKPLKIFYNSFDIRLTGVKLTGNIVVQSKTKITVDASSKLKDVILIAPEIELKNGVEGNFQIFATKEIIVSSHCKLDYPSAIVLNESNNISQASINNQHNTPSLKINSGSKISGCVVYLGKTKNYKAQVLIDDKATIVGEVYCNQNLELLGKVYGSLFTSGFVANQSGSAYQNHIYNGTININKLPEEYIGLEFENSKKGIAKWLY